ncbi:EscU/YscU/HrcU family type III secretion system export apparatus switch protein [Yoonia sp. SS1-5]|uniref:EscU/YscU/HrcU family type III secretion system export apparatus switch protein n=1 Tax=Yoonia rhodophyticola TaxID=3137370 RepID=A0AAN0MK33_9RHOB
MSDSQPKKHNASEKKLRKQREEGNVPQFSDVTSLWNFAVALVVIPIIAMIIIEHLMSLFSVVERAEVLDFMVVYRPAILAALNAVFLSVGVLILAKIVISVFTSMILLKGINFALKPLVPKPNRLSPAAGLKRMFGKRTWVEVGQGLLRLTAWFAVVLLTLYLYLDDLFHLDRCNENCAIILALRIFGILSTTAIVILLVSVLIEVPLQRGLYLKEQKMTDEEVKKERKEQFGSDEVRRERNRIRDEMARTAGSAGVDKANMIFFFEDRAVAIRYHPDHAPIPIVAAKAGTPEAVEKLRAAVKENGFSELQDQEIVETSFGTEPGYQVDEIAFKPLVRGMQAIFGG